MKRIIRDAIVRYLVSNNLLSSSQHGFENRKSCVTNLLENLDFLSKAKAEKKVADMIMLDFFKAFDKVPHQH